MQQRETSLAADGNTGELPYIQYGNRRDYKLWYKLQLVKESLEPGASVSIIARRHNLNSNVLFRWRLEYRRGTLRSSSRSATGDRFAAVGIVGENGTFEPISAPKAKVTLSPPHADVKPPSIKALPAPTPLSRAPAPGVIEMQLSGRIKIRIEGDVNKDALRRVLAVAREFA